MSNTEQPAAPELSCMVAVHLGVKSASNAAIRLPPGAMISTSVSGKVIAMWMPIMLFFFMGFEHSVVNMFLFPSAMIMGGDFSVMDYMVWNEIPTALGNLVGGLAFTGLTLYTTHVRTAPKRSVY